MLLKSLLLGILITFQSMAFATTTPNRVVLLISLDKDKNRPPLRFKSWDINKKLSKIFHNRLDDKSYDLAVIKNADQFQIHKELTNPLNKAIFWVGHANYGNNGAFNNTRIVDHKSRDIVEVFQAINPSLQFLGMVGCKTKKIFEDWRQKGILQKNPSLRIKASEKKVDARISLRRTIKEFLKRQKELKSGPACQEEPGLKFTITRETPADQENPGLPVRVLMGKKLLTVFPASKPGEIQEANVFLPISKSSIKSKDLKVVLQSGAPGTADRSKTILGKIDIQGSSSDFRWKLFANREGLPFGVGAHIYSYKGLKNIEQSIEMGLPIQCKGEQE